MNYKRSIQELENQAVLWWPEALSEANANINIIPKLIETQEDFLRVLALSKESPTQVFDIIKAAHFPANLFVKHLSVLADYGGEPIQRLGRSFADIFPLKNSLRSMQYSWEGNNYDYVFKSLPIPGLGNKKLNMDGSGFSEPVYLSPLYEDMIMILMHGSTSNACDHAALSSCEIGTLLGKPHILEKFVKQRYIMVSRITGGATSNSLGQLAQKEVVAHLRKNLGQGYSVISNGCIQLAGYNKIGGMPFDVVVERNNKKVGIEVSFQVTTNSTIERKAGQSTDRHTLMKNNGFHIAYIIDGAGNFQRKSAIATICKNSECTVAYSESEFRVLADWVRLVL